MEVIKIIAIGLIALILIILLKQYKPEFALYISLLTGVLILILVMDKLTGIIQLIQSISNKANINNQFITILIKITGIAFLSEFAVSIFKMISNKLDIIGMDIDIIIIFVPNSILLLIADSPASLQILTANSEGKETQP